MKKIERAQIINLLNVPKIRPQRVRNLLTHFEHGENVFDASKKELCQRSGVDIGLAVAIVGTRKLTPYGRSISMKLYPHLVLT